MNGHVRYEWIRETVEDGDIVNVEHFESRRDAERCAASGDVVGLTREVGSDDWGLQDRLWAYVQEDGSMPSHFSDSSGAQTGYTVPKRFLAS